MITTNTGTKFVEEAIAAMNNPEVQQIVEKLSHYGLAVAVPHMHSDKGEFLPLPEDTVSIEENLNVSFKNRSDIDENSTVPVMWTWDYESKSPVVSGKCGLECIVK